MEDYNRIYTAEELGEPRIFCETCGTEKTWRVLSLFGSQRHMAVYECDCLKKEEEEKKHQKRLDEYLHNIEFFKKNSHLTAKNQTFDNWQHNEYTQPAEDCYNTFIRFANNYRYGMQGLLVYGGAGCGKTHLSMALADSLSKKGAKTIFKNVPMLFEDIYASFNNSEVSTNQILEPIITSDVVVLDDLGAEKPTEFVQSKLYYIINCLYNKNATVIVTSNCTNVSDLKDIIGFRAYDRLLEMCNLVHNKGNSYRRFLQIYNQKKGA